MNALQIETRILAELDKCKNNPEYRNMDAMQVMAIVQFRLLCELLDALSGKGFLCSFEIEQIIWSINK